MGLRGLLWKMGHYKDLHHCPKEMTRWLKLDRTHQVIKDVTLVHVDGDERLKLGSLHLGQLFRGLGDESVEQLQEGIIGGRHDLAVVLGMGQGLGGIARPDQLKSQQAHLSRWQTA